MITSADEALIRRAKDALMSVTAKGYLSDNDKKALEQIVDASKPQPA